MEERSVVATGLDASAGYADILSYFKGAGAVEQLVRVLGPGMKFTGKAYIVYEKIDQATHAAISLSDGYIKVQALSEDKKEYLALVTPMPAGAEASKPEEDTFMQQWIKFTPEQQDMMRKMIGIEVDSPKTTSTPSTGGRFVGGGDQTVVLQEKPHISNFSGSAKDASYGRWKWEVTSLQAEGGYTQSTILEAVRKSLKSPAADVLKQLGSNPPLDKVLKKMTSLYGSILSGPAIMERFYKETQGDTSVAQWSITLEDWLYQATEKDAIPVPTIPDTLKHKFWSGLEEEEIKNGLRHRYQTLDFEDLVAEARSIEEEVRPRKSIKSSQVVDSTQDKLDLLIKKMDSMEADVKKLKAQVDVAPTLKPPVICKKCKLEGQLAFGCKDGEDFTCNKCNAKGHTSQSTTCWTTRIK